MIIVERFCDSPNETVSRIKFGSDFIYGIERPWLLNKPFESCIPIGEYRLKKRWSSRWETNLYEIADVPGRTHILFHIGNTAKDVQGCISPGNYLGVLKGQWAVLSSTIALRTLTEHLNSMEEPTIKICYKRDQGVLR